MFYGQNPFYFATVRKISVAFGTLFNNIHIQRFDQPGGQGNTIRTIHVPLSYASGEKWYVSRKQDVPVGEKVQTKISLPRIGYELTDIRYNNERQLNKLNGTTKPPSGDIVSFLNQLNPAPYDFQYDVYIAVKSMDDGLQIIEQILPNFQPSYNLDVKDIPELQIVKDVPVIFGGITKTDEFEGTFETQRILQWTLSFIVKGYMYPAIKDAGLIRRVIANVYQDQELSTKQEVITVKVDPLDANITDDWDTKTDIFDQDHLDSNQQPIVDSNFDPVV